MSLKKAVDLRNKDFYLSDLKHEKKAFSAIEKIVKKHGEDIEYLWRFGDGEGGSFIEYLKAEMQRSGFKIGR